MSEPGQERGEGRQPAAGSGAPASAAEDLAASFGYRKVDPQAKATMVRAVFDSVAERYDLMNDLMSGGIHRLWKAALIDWLAPRPGRHYLDVAGGTGDIAMRILDRQPLVGRVTLIDINYQMLRVGRGKAINKGRLANLDWVTGDAMALPLPGNAVDAYTIAFGMRNVTHIERALAEAHRVLRPGGRFLCLEFSRVFLPVLDKLYDRYSFNVLPLLGRIVAQDAESYRYLAESIRRFPDQATYLGLVRAAGFRNVTYRNVSGGIAAIHSGWKI
ncbi:bifunctional demethylmenaquinone methyltransferase/2-methoxy-6-polyprenyl-1,4-benzoquinol methylase UbiE [Arboricoccus pini]|nr:bifunctional demethylmenaquinone methyltransferase/2-methoxy-6-polyprenyl-1,4-benzoquinol methylase UbiE [Arboricoccus pini]